MTLVHARQRRRKWQYRLWQRTSDRYLTPPCSEEDIRFEILLRHLMGATLECAIGIEESLTKAREHGSNERDPQPTAETGPWEQQSRRRESFVDDRFKVAYEITDVVEAALREWIKKKKTQDPNWSLAELSKKPE